jgi:hypothetical protein
VNSRCKFLDYINLSSALQQHLDKDVPDTITAIGNLDILSHNSTSLFCSTKYPGDLIVKTYDIAQILRDAGMTVISGFHSPMERECLSILLRVTRRPARHYLPSQKYQ